MSNLIQTKYMGPTNYRGSRIKAVLNEGINITIAYPYELDGVECHMAAVSALCLREGLTMTDFDHAHASYGKGYIFISK